MISDAVLLIQTCNSAYSVIKQAVSNGKELSECGSSLSDYFTSKSELQKKADPSGRGGGLQAFLALEQLKVQESQLKELLIYSGRAGLWQDWLRFQAEEKRLRDDAKADLQRKKVARAQAIKTGFAYFGVLLLVLSAVGAGLAMVYYLTTLRGK